MNELSGFILGYLLEIDAIEFAKSINFSPKQTYWKPPDLRSIKLNFDTSYNVVLKTSMSEILTRDEMGHVMGACTYPHVDVADAFVIEGRACERAVSLRLTWGFDVFRLKGIR